jgi:hypothetical protein
MSGRTAAERCERPVTDLVRIGDAEEVAVASRRADGTLGPYTTMWVVRVGDDLYVRSAGGPNRPWYRHAIASGAGRIRAGGIEKDVTFASAPPDVHPAIDTAYQAKYARYGPHIVGSVVGERARAVTLRLVPIE